MEEGEDGGEEEEDNGREGPVKTPSFCCCSQADVYGSVGGSHMRHDRRTIT